MPRSFGQSQKRTHGTIMPLRARRVSGMVRVSRHGDLHGGSVLSVAKGLFNFGSKAVRKGSKAVRMAKKFANSDLAKKAIKAGKTAVKIGKAASELYGSETGQAVKQMLLPASDPSFGEEQHAILRRTDGKMVTANYLGPRTRLKERLERGDIGATPVDMLAMKHDIAYRKAQGAGSKALQLKMIRKADKDMIAGLRKIIGLKADHPLNIAQARLIIAKLTAEQAGLIPQGAFGGNLEAIGEEEMNLLNAGQNKLEMMGYGRKTHPAMRLKKKLTRQYGRGAGASAGARKGHSPIAEADIYSEEDEDNADEIALIDKMIKALEARMLYEEGSMEDVYRERRLRLIRKRNAIVVKGKEVQDSTGFDGFGGGLRLAGQRGRGRKRQEGGFIFSLSAIIASISAAAATATTAAVAAAPTVAAIAGTVGTVATAAEAVKGLVGEGLKSRIRDKIKQVAKKTGVKLKDIPIGKLRAFDAKLKVIKKLNIPIVAKKAMIVQTIAKPLIPLVKKKYNEKLRKSLKGSGLKLSGQKGSGLRLAGGAVSNADILKKLT